eukprot:gene14832-16372_t
MADNSDLTEYETENESFEKEMPDDTESSSENEISWHASMESVLKRKKKNTKKSNFSSKKRPRLGLLCQRGPNTREVQATVVKVRNKFKKLVSECKKVALTTSTASGIKQFQDKFGKWFELLYPVVKQRESCDPDQSIEPCTEMTEGGTLLDNSVIPESSSREDGPGKSSRDDGPGSSREDGKSNEKEKREKLFIPKKQAHKIAMEKIDKTDNLIQYFQQQNERAKQHDLQLFKMLTAANTPQALTMQHTHQPLTMQHNVMQGFSPPTSQSQSTRLIIKKHHIKKTIEKNVFNGIYK